MGRKPLIELPSSGMSANSVGISTPPLTGPGSLPTRKRGRPRTKGVAILSASAPISATRLGPSLEGLSTGELRFLHAYFDANSATKGDANKAASAAGYSQAAKAATKILKKYDQALFASALEAVGMSKMTLALRLKRIIDDPTSDNKEVISATKMMLTAMGERTEAGGSSVNVNVAAPKSLVMVGFDSAGISNMLKGKKQLPESTNGETESAVVEGELLSSDNEIQHSEG